MAYKNCIKRLKKKGHEVTLDDRRRIKQYMEEGLTDSQAITRLLAESALDTIETIDRIEAQGLEVETPVGQLAEIRDFRTEQLRAQMAKRTEAIAQIEALEKEYDALESDADMFDEVLGQGIGEEVAFLDLTEAEAKLYFGQLMMRATTTELPTGKPGQDPGRVWPEDRFRHAMEKGLLLVEGRTPQEIYDSRVDLEKQMAAKKKEILKAKDRKAETQAEIERRFGPDTVTEPDILLQEDTGKRGKQLEAVAAKAGVQQARTARLLGMTLYGDMRDIQKVTVKELFQNSFDAVRTALANGDIEEGDGLIEFEISDDKRTLTIKDNGVGMGPEQITEGFLKIGGTMKEGDLNSGGYGVAKGLFLAGAKKLELETVRDGVKTTLTTTGDDFNQSLDDPNHSLDQRYPADEVLRREETDQPNGTKIRVTLPDQFQDWRTGNVKDVEPFANRQIWHATDDQILVPGMTVKQGYDEDGQHMHTASAGDNFDTWKYDLLDEVRFEWGTVEVLVETEERSYRGSDNTQVSVHGLKQFDITTMEDPWSTEAEPIKRQIHFNLKPDMEPDQEGYPISLNRQGFQDHAEQDIRQLKAYLSVLVWRDKSMETTAGYGRIQTIDADGNLGEALDLTPPAPDVQTLEGRLDTGTSLEVRGGQLYVDGKPQDVIEKDDLESESPPDMRDYQIDQELVPLDLPLINSNMEFVGEDAVAATFVEDLETPVTEGQDLLEALRAEFGEERVNEYYFKIGNAFLNLRNMIAVKGDQDLFAGVDKVGVGVTVMKNALGVHTKVPARMMFINPGQIGKERRARGALTGPPAKDDLGPEDFEAIATSMMTTMYHEIAHYAAWNHNLEFIQALQSIFATGMVESDFVDGITAELQETLSEQWEIYRFIANAVESDSVRTTGLSITDVGTKQEYDEASAVDAAARSSRQGRESLGDEVRQGERDPGREFDDDRIRAGRREGGVVVPEGSVHPNAGEDSTYFQTVFHGSPFTFDEFDMAQMGTGEGAQMYGWGLYFAEEPDVAKAYVPRDFDAEAIMLERYQAAEQANDVVAMEMWEDAMLHWTPDEIRVHYRDTLADDPEALARAEEMANELEQILAQAEGQLYQVELNDEQAAMMMDWDAPVIEMPPEVQAAIKEVVNRTRKAFVEGILAEWDERDIEQTSGGAIYRALSDDLGGDREASLELLSVGIPGHKFLDQQSRVSPITAGRTGFIGAAADLARPQTRNMVLYDTAPIDEVRRGGELVYSKPLAAEAGEVGLEKFMEGSHVVNEDGSPMIVYHGTQTTEPFDVFDPEKGMSWGGWNAVGTWHSSERVHAERYSTYPPGDEREGQLFENYVSIKDPFEGTWEEVTEAMQQVLEDAGTDQFTEGSGRVFREHLQGLGYDGIIIRDFDGDGAPTQDLFVPFESNQIKSVEAEVFDPADPSILRQGGERGRITFNEARKGFIEILSSGDVSTFIHETGHLYLEVLRWAAQEPNAPAQLKRDWETVKKFTGATDQHISRDAHEKFANSFEVYTLEGKAPSIALQDSFSFFRSWMTRIYAKLKNIAGVHLDPEIRDVMDRLLASEEEIAIAEQSQGYVALFATAEDAGMSQAEFDLYAKQVQREHDDNVGKEHRRLMAAMQRDDMKWWKDQRRQIRAEVEEELHQDKRYIALYYLQRGKQPDGTPTRDQATKIDKQSLLQLLNHDQQALNDLPRPFIYTLKGGTDVEVLARRLNFRNGLEMIDALSNLPRLKDAIEAETEIRMRKMFPDPMTDGTLPDNALRRVHSEGRLRILTKELRKLRQLAAEDRPAVRAAQQAERQRDRQAQQANRAQIPGRAEMAMIKAAAREVINKMPIGKIKPHIYLRGEQKAGREAFAALEKRDYEAAYEAKLRQIKNHEMYRAALAAAKKMESTRKRLNRYTGPRKRRQLGLAKVLDQVDAVLENVDLKKKSMVQVEREKALKGLKQAVLDGRMIVTPATQRKIMDESVHWTEFTPQEFTEIADVIKQIEHGALNEDKMTVNDELVDYKEVRDELTDEILTNNEEVKLRPGGVQTVRERGNSNVDQSIMTWLRPSSIARILDKAGFGAITRRIIVPIRRAYAEKLIPMLHEAQKDVAAIYNKHYSLTELGQMSKRQYKINTLEGELYTKSELLSMALNWGNQGNRDAVLGGIYKNKAVFTEQAVREMLANLTAKDWAFVQDIWDYNESYWEELASAEERRRGVRPEKVEALPFTIRTADGQLITVRGGYHPLRYDHRFDARDDRDTTKLKAEEAIDQALTHIANGTFVTANTRAGATYNRVKNHGRVVRLGLNIIDSHLREVIRDIAIGDEVRHVKRLMDDGSVERAFRDTGNGAAYEALGLWLTDAAVGELPAENAIEFGIAWIRTGFTKAKLGWNFAVMALQLTGLFQTMAVIGTRAFTTGFVKYIQNPAAATRHVMDQSSFLNTRYEVGGFDKDVQDTKAIVESEFGSMPTKTKRAYNIVANTLFAGIAWFQKIVDVVTWLGAYEKGLNEINQDKGGLSEQEAVYYADTQVEAAQTSGFFSDRSGLERGTTGLRKNRQSQLLRIWTTLISYMLAKSNIAYEKYKDTDFKDPKQVMDLLLDMILLYTIEGIASAIIYQRWPEDDDEPEDWAKWAAVQSLDSLTAGVPFVREVAAARFGGGNTPVGVFSNDAMNLIEQISQGELDWTAVDAVSDVTGTLLHLPTGQMSKTGEKLWEEGLTTDEWWEYFTGPKD